MLGWQLAACHLLSPYDAPDDPPGRGPVLTSGERPAGDQPISTAISDVELPARPVQSLEGACPLVVVAQDQIETLRELDQDPGVCGGGHGWLDLRADDRAASCELRYHLLCQQQACGATVTAASWQILAADGTVLWQSALLACDSVTAASDAPLPPEATWRTMPLPAGATTLRASASGCNGACLDDVQPSPALVDVHLHFQLLRCCPR